MSRSAVDPEERYALYQVKDGELIRLVTAPTAGGIGLAIERLSLEGDLDPMKRVGVRDREQGRWLVFPWPSEPA